MTGTVHTNRGTVLFFRFHDGVFLVTNTHDHMAHRPTMSRLDQLPAGHVTVFDVDGSIPATVPYQPILAV